MPRQARIRREARIPVTVARFTASELEDILGHVAAAANHSRRAKLRRELDALYDRLESLEAAALRSGDAF